MSGCANGSNSVVYRWLLPTSRPHREPCATRQVRLTRPGCVVLHDQSDGVAFAAAALGWGQGLVVIGRMSIASGNSAVRYGSRSAADPAVLSLRIVATEPRYEDRI
jgi:hypothetical protein